MLLDITDLLLQGIQVLVSLDCIAISSLDFLQLVLDGHLLQSLAQLSQGHLLQQTQTHRFGGIVTPRASTRLLLQLPDLFDQLLTLQFELFILESLPLDQFGHLQFGLLNGLLVALE